MEGDPNAGIINDPAGHPKLDGDTLAALNEKDGEKNISTGYHAIEYLLWGQDLYTDGPGRRTAIMAAPDPITAEHIAAAGTSSKGMPAIEYLMFDPNGGNAAVLVTLGGADAATMRRCEYARALGEALAKDAAWSEEGFRFAWRVMVVEKVGFVEHRVRVKSSGRTWMVAPSHYLSPLQTKMMSISPDMILELAQHIAREQKERVGEAEVYADAFVTMNGRPSRRIVDPSVDLSRERDSLLPKAWILPLDDGP